METVIKLNPTIELPIMGVKILGESHAEDFVNKGVIHFSNPQTWRNVDLCSGKQLDVDEGCFCFSTKKNDALFEQMGRKFKKLRDANGWKYFECNDHIIGTCFYGILRSRFKDSIMQYGAKTIQTKDLKVPLEYFKEFNDGLDIAKKTVIILDFYRFIDMIVNHIASMGVSREDIHISNVYYVNKKVPYCTTEPFPFEYFLKDALYSKQSELRILITSGNKSFYDSLAENGNNIEIGDISSFANLQDNYSDDLYFSIQDDKLIYSLAKPITLSLDDRNAKQLISELYQTMYNFLPGEAKGKEELDALAKPVIEHLKKKYGIEFKDDWKLYNVPRSIYNTLSDFHKGMCITIIED